MRHILEVPGTRHTALLAPQLEIQHAHALHGLVDAQPSRCPRNRLAHAGFCARNEPNAGALDEHDVHVRGEQLRRVRGLGADDAERDWDGLIQRVGQRGRERELVRGRQSRRDALVAHTHI